MGRVTKGERSGAARLIPRARASRTSQNVKSWKVARVGPVLPERAASEGPRSTGAVGPTRAPFQGPPLRAPTFQTGVSPSGRAFFFGVVGVTHGGGLLDRLETGSIECGYNKSVEPSTKG